MNRHRLWWPLLTAMFLSACSSLPAPDEAVELETPVQSGESPYLLKARRGGNPTLSELRTEPGIGLRAVAPLTVPTDLWDRIRRGFAMEDLDNEQVREREANRFAAELLMPEERVRASVETDGADVVGQADRFEVSQLSMAWRLFNLGYIRRKPKPADYAAG